jgi:hypothetical protein
MIVERDSSDTSSHAVLIAFIIHQWRTVIFLWRCEILVLLPSVRCRHTIRKISFTTPHRRRRRYGRSSTVSRLTSFLVGFVVKLVSRNMPI